MRACLPGHGRQRPAARWQRSHRHVAWNAGVAWPSRLGPCWARSALGWSLEPGCCLSLRSVAQAESGRGPVVPMGRPSSNRKIVFGFSFIIWEDKYFGKWLCTHFGSKFVGFFCCVPCHQIYMIKILHVIFEILFCRALFNS